MSLPDYQVSENQILDFGLQENKKEDKSGCVTKSVGITVTIISM